MWKCHEGAQKYQWDTPEFISRRIRAKSIDSTNCPGQVGGNRLWPLRFTKHKISKLDRRRNAKIECTCLLEENKRLHEFEGRKDFSDNVAEHFLLFKRVFKNDVFDSLYKQVRRIRSWGNAGISRSCLSSNSFVWVSAEGYWGVRSKPIGDNVLFRSPPGFYESASPWVLFVCEFVPITTHFEHLLCDLTPFVFCHCLCRPVLGHNSCLWLTVTLYHPWVPIQSHKYQHMCAERQHLSQQSEHPSRE